MIDTPKSVGIEDLFPELSPDEQREMQAFFDEYFVLLLKISERLKDEGEERQFDGLTESA
jgi:hypothetical protein